MIRLIGRRLIIPRGDTGTLTIPTQGPIDGPAIAILGIYDPLFNEIHELPPVTVEGETISFDFRHEDTIDLEPSERYQWDIKIYRNPIYDDNHQLISADNIDSYYAAFGVSMPKCVIKQVATNV